MGNSARVDLLTNASATGTLQRWPGGKGRFYAHGTFGGGEVKLQLNSNQDGFDNLLDTSNATILNADGSAEFFAPAGEIQATVTGGTPSALFAFAVRE